MDSNFHLAYMKFSSSLYVIYVASPADATTTSSYCTITSCSITLGRGEERKRHIWANMKIKSCIAMRK